MAGQIKKSVLVAALFVLLCATIALCGCSAKTYTVTFNIDGTVAANEQVTTTITVNKDNKEIGAASTGGTPANVQFTLENGSYSAVAQVYVVRNGKTYTMTSDPTTFEIKDKDQTIPLVITSFIENAKEITQ